MPARSSTFPVSSAASMFAGVVMLSAASPSPASVLSNQKISDTQGGFTAVIDNLDEFGGATVSLGDLDGAGPSVAALAVGTVGDDDGTANRGALYILFLNSSGSVISYQKISSTVGGFTGVLESADDFGSSVAYLGDLDGAGPSVAALAVGATGDDDGAALGNRGAVYILFLDSAGVCLTTTKISDTVGGFTPPLLNGDEFGGAVAWLGDLDGPGPSVAALAVGTIGDDNGGLNRGAVYILFLNSAGTCLSSVKISDTQGNFNFPLATADEFGSSVAWLGDLDGAGPSAGCLAVGAIGDENGGPDRGAVYLLFLDTAGTIGAQKKISDTQGNFDAVLDNLDEFGGALTNLGDIDRWGPARTALVVGAAGDDDGGPSHGAFYILYLDSAGEILTFRDSSGVLVTHQKVSETTGGFTAPLHDADEFGGALTALGDLDGPHGPQRQTIVSGASFDDDGGDDRGAVYVLFVSGPGTDTELPPLAMRYALGPAQPNPFNPRTTIPFRMDDAGWVEIGIWNAQGRLVRTLVPGKAERGEHEILWDGLDHSGRPLASGSYFYRMSVNGSVVTAAQKAVLLK